jgi:hypothetical protein
MSLLPHKAPLDWRSLAVTAALFARSISEHLAGHDLRASPAAQALAGRWRKQAQRPPDGLYLGLDGHVGGLMAARERLQRAEGGRSGLADGQLSAALVGPDQSPGGRGGLRRERDLQQALVKPALCHRLSSQGRLGGGEVSMFMVGVTLYLGVEAAVGGLSYRQILGGYSR